MDPAEPGDAHLGPDATPRYDRDARRPSGLASLAGRARSVCERCGPNYAPLPRISFGRYSVSRLICGANPFGGGSHLSVFVNREMRRYYTPERILKTLRRCQEVGINCWQSAGDDYKLHRRLVDEGGRLHYISLGEGDPSFIDTLAGAGCIAVAHHGEFTDQMFKEGRLEEMHDYLKRVRDAGRAL